jgi:hypothetical protein
VWWSLLPVVGFISLVWFVLRVLPKPSRAAYPCQRVAMPLASGFVLWLSGLVGAALAFRKSRVLLAHSRVWLGCLFLAAAGGLGLFVLATMPERPVMGEPPQVLAPIGDAKGIYPGRVVWAHDPDATDWTEGTGHWWESSHTNQTVVDQMMSQILRGLTGESSDADAWDALFRHYNQTHGHGDVGYMAGQKIAIKVNFVGNHQLWNTWGGCNPYNHDLTGVKDDYMNTSPQVMLALLRQLINVAGVQQQDISIGDPTCFWADPYFNPLHNEFPSVHYMEFTNGSMGGTEGREGVLLADGQAGRPYAPVYWSSHPTGVNQDYLPVYYAEASYFINLANLKSHQSDGGITVCAKNHYGSLRRYPVEGGYYDIHSSLPAADHTPGRYRAVVDLMGHAHTGGKTVLFLLDGLYAGRHPWDSVPLKWTLCPPFNTYPGGDWSSMLMASQDPVAIDSVAYDFLRTEWPDTNGPLMAGTEDYLHEAAQANSPPSGTFYDPDHAANVTRLPNLGVHEHWNNATDKEYSRNLGTGDGIELIPVGPPVADIDANPTDGLRPLLVSFDGSGSQDYDGVIVSYEWDLDGDGSTDATGPTTSHTYQAAGEYTVTLMVTDNDSLVDTDTVVITVAARPGDFDNDDDADMSDFGHLQACLAGAATPLAPACENADLDHDGVVGPGDVAVFRGCMSGADNPVDPNCAP